MKPYALWPTLLLLLTSPTFAAVASPRTTDPSLQIQTTSGLVTGFINSTYPSVRQFLGIPFAKAPTGDLRFAAPQPLSDASKESVDGTKIPCACPQYASNATSVYNTDAPEFSENVSTCEECLTLTVWTPTKDKCSEEGLPVFAWIYGGGFQTGATEVPYQLPPPWIQQSPTHLVVSLQYRLNIFGYPNAAGLNTSNPGLLDQRAALEWLRDNIAAFGGNPDQIVTWGQSAGAFSVDFINFAHPTDPIVKGQICDSGTALQLSTSVGYSNFSFVADAFGCPSVSKGATAADELACMRTIPFQDIENFLKNYSDAGTQPNLSFNPVPDNKTVFPDYAERYALGPGVGVSSIPSIYGTNRDEGNSLIPYPNPPTNPPDQSAAEQVTLSTFLCPAVDSAQLRKQAGLKTYRYYYEGNFTDISPRYWMGAYHSSELPLVFGTRGQFRGPATAFEEEVSKAMQDLWVAFAQNPETATGWVEAGDTGEVTVFAKGSPADGTAVTTVAAGDIDGGCSTMQ